MSDLAPARPPRILVVDDNTAIHDDFRKILAAETREANRFNNLEQALFGDASGAVSRATFRVDSALQGQEGLDLLNRALQENDPYLLAFVDVRMPPGWDGIETLSRLWQACPDLQAVICTAYSDYSWDELTRQLPRADNLLILKKPFDTVEVLQITHALTKKWELACQAKLRMEDLEQMVQERTSALQQTMTDRLKLEAQLRHATKMEAIGCLAAGIAHEFNNLLTVIQGHAGLLRGTPHGAPNGVDSVERIMQASIHAASLTRRLLAFSRKQPLHLKPLDLSAAVKAMKPMLGRLLGENYPLELKCDSQPLSTFADDASIQQTLINLVVNARDAMPSGGTIRVSTSLMTVAEAEALQHLDARPGRFACLTVSDSGCGMKPEVIERIFDPFFTTKEVGQGTGLGLATVHGIVQQHRGWIQVTSQPGQGSTFRVFFPAWDGPSQLALEAKAEGNRAIYCGNGEGVLLVEDEDTVREMARLALEHGGYRVFEAADGPQALEVWEKSPVRIELLVTDMVMPNGLSGASLARQLQARDPRLRTLFTSGYSSSAEAFQEDRSLLSGANFQPKPYDPITLLKTVKQCLEPGL